LEAGPKLSSARGNWLEANIRFPSARENGLKVFYGHVPVLLIIRCP